MAGSDHDKEWGNTFPESFRKIDAVLGLDFDVLIQVFAQHNIEPRASAVGRSTEACLGPGGASEVEDE